MSGKGSLSTTGHPGVSRNTGAKTFRVHYKRRYIGSFRTLDEASAAYREVRKASEVAKYIDETYGELFGPLPKRKL